MYSHCLLEDKIAYSFSLLSDGDRLFALAPRRFLQVHPASVEDERLLAYVVAFLNAYFKHARAHWSDPEDMDLRWMLELLLNEAVGSIFF